MKLNELLMIVNRDDRSEEVMIRMMKAAFNKVDALEAQISEYQKQVDEYDEVLNMIRKYTRVRYSDHFQADVIVIDFKTFYPDDKGFDLVKKYLVGDEDEKEEE